MKSILSSAGIKVAFKPINTLSNKFQVPKARPPEEKTKAIIVYRYQCGSFRLRMWENLKDVGRRVG